MVFQKKSANDLYSSLTNNENDISAGKMRLLAEFNVDKNGEKINYKAMYEREVKEHNKTRRLLNLKQLRK